MRQHSLGDFLDGDTIAALRKPTSEAKGLPGVAFTDEDFFRLEQRTLFPRSWMSVAFAHDISGPGDALPITVTGLPVVLVRGGDGEIRAFHNVCRHRGTKVVLEPMKGASTLRCLYHSWSWDLNGRLRATPLWDGTKNPSPPGIDKAQNGLVPIRCAIWCGVVYLNLAGDAPPLEANFGFLYERHAIYDFDALEPVLTKSWDFEANWKLGVEGVIEGYHEPWVHPQLPSRVARGGEPMFTGYTEGNCLGSGVPSGSEYAMDEIGGGGGLPSLPGPADGADRPLDVFMQFPNTTVVVFRDHYMRWIWTPLAVDRTRVSAAFFVAREAALSPEFADGRAALFAFWDEIMAQDGAAVAAQQEARHSPVADDLKFSPFWEARAHYFETLVVDAMS